MTQAYRNLYTAMVLVVVVELTTLTIMLLGSRILVPALLLMYVTVGNLFFRAIQAHAEDVASWKVGMQ
jgi:hypothetical protein